MFAQTALIRPELPDDDAAVETLHEIAFGPGRFAKTAYRLREGVPFDPDLSFVAVHGPTVIGSVRLTPIFIGTTPATLLGPLVVHPGLQSRGTGRQLMQAAMAATQAKRAGPILLVGDRGYYEPLGFTLVRPGTIVLPGPVDPNRLLLAPAGAEGPFAGAVRKARPGRA
ncbi:N-acetyltransferase [Pseudoxanthobacter sp.]|uniref:GNAT family N-acetyltransferase n=1 Tax=Pseudoxanthobacter sp. TaxID=1925742 RepID=UPI002FE12802